VIFLVMQTWDIAKAAKLNEKALYRTLGKTGNPGFATRLLQALGITLTVKPPSQLRRTGSRQRAA
jgi:DNA-binding phage protein